VLGYKYGNNVPSVDNKISLYYTMVFVDDPIDVNRTFYMPISVSIDGLYNSTINQTYTLFRTGAEKPVINMTAAILNNTASAFTSKYRFYF
jgi:hypothetical protein